MNGDFPDHFTFVVEQQVLRVAANLAANQGVAEDIFL